MNEEIDLSDFTQEEIDEYTERLLLWLDEETIKSKEKSLRSTLSSVDLDFSEETIARTQDRVEARIKRLATGETTLEQEEEQLFKEFRERLPKVKDYKYANNLLNSPDVDQAIKDDFEREVTHVRSQQLKENPVKGNFDLEHLATIHKKLFDGLYDHAGQTR